jgi:fructuronate reductase
VSPRTASGREAIERPKELSNLPLLGREGAEAPPVRIVHIGLGAFHRSHQAWFTHRAPDADQWGIASFTGRRPAAAQVLSSQDGLFTLVERGVDGDRLEVVSSIAEAVDGADTARLEQLLASQSTAIVTLTITEAVYEHDGPDTPLGRLVRGLRARRAAGAGGLAVVSCDNVAGNGEVARAAVLRIAAAQDDASPQEPALADWVRENVSFVATSVDRITPRTTEGDVMTVAAECGYRDAAPVVAEPFASWILSGDFPAGRPSWESVGARFVTDLRPFENRKLWLLNGAHSLLAYAGRQRGHATVAEAMSDERCRGAVEALWDEAQKHLTEPGLDVPEYRKGLLERFGNPRISHVLDQIAADGTTKLRMRAVPLLRAERRAGRSGTATARMIAAWIDYVSTDALFQDPLREAILAICAGDGRERTARLLALIEPALAEDPELVGCIEDSLGSFTDR